MSRFIIFYAILFSFILKAQERYKIELETKSTGNIGSRLINMVENEFNKSASFVLVGKDDENRKIKILIYTFDKKSGYENNYYMETIFNVIWLFDTGKYSDHYCKSGRYDYVSSTQSSTWGEHLRNAAYSILTYTLELTENYAKSKWFDEYEVEK